MSTTSAEYADIDICTDCALMAANDDDGGNPRVREDYYAGIADWREDFAGPVVVIVTDDDPCFRSTARCGVCGSRWGGDYHRARVEPI